MSATTRVRVGIMRAVRAATQTEAGGDFTWRDIERVKEAWSWIQKWPACIVLVVLTPAQAKALIFAASNAIEDNEQNGMMREANLLRAGIAALKDS